MKKLEYLPRIYRLGWDTPTATLFVSFNKEEIPKMKNWLDVPNRFMLELVKPLNENPINIEPFGKPVSFGFDDVFHFHSESQDEITYSWTLEPMVGVGNKKCSDCNGTGLHKINDRKCYKCRGGGKEFEDIANNFRSGLFTLWTLTKVADYLTTSYIANDLSVESKLAQDICILFSHTSGRNNCFSSGWISDEVLDWLKTLDKNSKEQVQDAMRKTEELLLQKETSKYDFRISTSEDGRFSLSVPGDACTLGPSSHGINSYQIGHMLFDHNVDHQFQQVAFIAGLAKIQDIFSKRIWMSQDIAAKMFDKANPIIKRTARLEPKDGTCLIKGCPEKAVGYGVYTWESRCGATLFKACQQHLDEFSDKELEKNPFEMKPTDELIKPAWS